MEGTIVLQSKHNEKIKRHITPEKRINQDEALYNDVYKICPELADCAIALGGSSIVFYAQDRLGKSYLVKKIISPGETDYTDVITEKLKTFYRDESTNYFLGQAFYGEDENKEEYHLFDRVNGETPKPQFPKTIKEFSKLFKEIKGFLRCLETLHKCKYQGDKCYVHFDVKPDNIFRFRANQEDEYCMQLIDFGSARAAYDVQKDMFNEGIAGYKYASTEGWYDTSYKFREKHCNKIKEDFEYACVVDITAAVKVLCYLICGENNGFHFGYCPTQYEGTFRKLHSIWNKATAKDIDDRYTSCQELISDIDVLIESCDGNITKPEALRIVAMNTWYIGDTDILCCDKNISDIKFRYCKEHFDSKDGEKKWKQIRFQKLIGNIKPWLLTKFVVSDTSCNYESSFNPIEFMFENCEYEENIVLQGTGGIGKSTAIEYLYLCSCYGKLGNVVYLRLCGEDFKSSEVEFYGDSKIMRILQSKYKGCVVEKLLKNYNPISAITKKRNKSKTPICILLDAVDEIPEKCLKSVCDEIAEFNKWGIRFIITSRYVENLRNYISNSRFSRGKMHLLTSEQVEKEVGFVEDPKIAELVRRPMLLLIYKRICEQGNLGKIKNANDLIEEYFKKIQSRLNKTEREKKHFMGDMLDYCQREIPESEIQEAKKFMRDNRIEHIMDFELVGLRESFNGCNDVEKMYRVTFSHELYREYIEYKIEQIAKSEG